MTKKINFSEKRKCCNLKKKTNKIQEKYLNFQVLQVKISSLINSIHSVLNVTECFKVFYIIFDATI